MYKLINQVCKCAQISKPSKTELHSFDQPPTRSIWFKSELLSAKTKKEFRYLLNLRGIYNFQMTVNSDNYLHSNRKALNFVISVWFPLSMQHFIDMLVG